MVLPDPVIVDTARLDRPCPVSGARLHRATDVVITILVHFRGVGLIILNVDMEAGALVAF